MDSKREDSFRKSQYRLTLLRDYLKLEPLPDSRKVFLEESTHLLEVMLSLNHEDGVTASSGIHTAIPESHGRPALTVVKTCQTLNLFSRFNPVPRWAVPDSGTQTSVEL